MRCTRRHEEGGIAVMVALMCGVFAALTLVVLHAGKLAVAQQEIRGLADAAALGGAALLRERGTAGEDIVDITPLESMIKSENTSLPAEINVTVVPHEPDAAVISVRADVVGTYRNPFALLGNRSFVLRATSYASVKQWDSGTKWPAVVIMVDASGSMSRSDDYKITDALRDLIPFLRQPGSVQPSRYQVLTEVIKDYVSQPYPMRNGLVVFNENTSKVVRPPETNMAGMQGIIDGLNGVTPKGGTHFEKAFESAGELLEEQADSVIMITDGQPTRGGTKLNVLGVGIPIGEITQPILGQWSPFWDTPVEAGRAAANRVREKGSLFCLETKPSSGKSRKLLMQIAGGPEDTTVGDQEYYYGINNIDDLQGFHKGLYLATCRKPLKVPEEEEQPEEEKTFAFFRDPDGEEEALERIPYDEVDTSTNMNAFAFKKSDSTSFVQLTKNACFKLAYLDGRRLIVRWGGTRLVCQPESTSVLDCLEQ